MVSSLSLDRIFPVGKFDVNILRYFVQSAQKNFRTSDPQRSIAPQYHRHDERKVKERQRKFLIIFLIIRTEKIDRNFILTVFFINNGGPFYIREKDNCSRPLIYSALDGNPAVVHFHNFIDNRESETA